METMINQIDIPQKPVIGILDTGIDSSHPWLENSVIGGVTICENPEKTCVTNDYPDRVGHGTAVASIAHAFCPEAQLYAVRIYGLDLKKPVDGVSETVLAAAITHCLEKGIRIINLSFSLAKPTQGGQLEAVCKQSFEVNCIITASHRSDGGTYYPAGYTSVLGVRRTMKCSPGEVAVLSMDKAEVATWGGPATVPDAFGGCTRSKGASLSAPSVAGLVARARAVRPEITLTGILELFQNMEERRGQRSLANATR